MRPHQGSLSVLAAIASTEITSNPKIKSKEKRQTKAGRGSIPIRRAAAVPTGVEEEGETSSSDDRVVLRLSGAQDMVEESRKRKGTQQQHKFEVPAVAKKTGNAAGDGNCQDAFAAFASQYRDVLCFANADEAEAVYSMVALTQAKEPEWATRKQQAAAVELPDGRPAKRQQVAACAVAPAAPACSEGGSSDSSGKSAPSPNLGGQQLQQQAVMPGAPGLQDCMLAGPMVHPGAQMQCMPPSIADAATTAVGNGGLCMPCSMPLLPGFFPPGMLGMPGAPGCPMPPFLPPWAMPPGIMPPMMFGNMGMFGSMPPGSPPMMPMPPPGMPVPGMPLMPPACMAGVPIGPGSATEPAAGIPINVLGSATAANTKATSTAAGWGPASCDKAVNQQRQSRTPTSCTANPTAAVTGGSSKAASPACVTAAGKSVGVHQVLDTFDVVALKPWVLSHFCEDVYLLLLDVWRPDSAKVRDAVWAWKLHVKAPRPDNSPPDYRAFLVSLFGLEKLLQLTAADRAAKGSNSNTAVASPLPAPVPLQIRRDNAASAHGIDTVDRAGSGNSSAAVIPAAPVVG